MKHRGYYLKRVCFLLGKEQYLQPFEDVINKLEESGIACQVAGAGEWSLPPSIEEETLLYVTDSGKTARELLAGGAAVLGYSHDESKEEDFSGVKYLLEQPQGVEPEYFERVFRRYAGLPWSILETQRCYVRESCAEDVEAFYTIYAEPEITRYLDDLYESPASEKAHLQEYIQHMYAYYEFGIWTVILKETGEVIGRAGLSVREGYELPELGYVLGVPWQGKGLAKEVCEQILVYAWEELGLEKVQILIQKENEASVYLAKGLGFVYERSLYLKGKEYLFLVKIYTL